jgi:uncharacterized membrane protein (UPF0182 family)
MTDPQQFFQKATLWDIAPNPDAASTATAATSATQGGDDGGRNTTLRSAGNGIDPLYLMMDLPGINDGQEFVLQRPFVPRSKANQLSSFMIARNDGKNYGKLVLYQMPTDSVAPSPSRAASLIEANTDISRTFTLLDQRKSKVIRGATQLVPVGDSIFYVRPIFVLGEGSGSYPRWTYVAVTYGEKAILSRVGVADAVEKLLELRSTPTDPGEEPTTPPTTTPTTPTSQPPSNATVSQLIGRLVELRTEKKNALADQDFAAYGKAEDEEQQIINRLNNLLGPASSTSTSTPGSTTSTTSPRTTTTTTPRQV